MPQLVFFIKKNQKMKLTDHLVEQQYAGGWDDFLIEKLRDNVISNAKVIDKEQVALPTGIVKFDSENLLKITIKHDPKFKKDGDKCIIIAGTKLYNGLENSYRLDNHINKKINKIYGKSFEFFVQEIIDYNIDLVVDQQYQSELDAEIRQIKSEKKAEKKPKKETK